MISLFPAVRPLHSMVFLACALFFTGTAGGTQAKTELPDAITASARPYYRRLPDGAPGREVMIRFSGGKFVGDAEIVVEGPTSRRMVTLRAALPGIDSTAILLPSEVGVEREETVRVVIRTAGASIETRVTVPPMRHWTVYVYPHSHVDIGYSNTYKNVEFIHRRNIDQGVKRADETRNFPRGARYVWNTEVMWPFERYAASASPEKRRWLVDAVKRGALALDAAYVHLLTSAAIDEELFQTLRPRREAAQLTGSPLDTYVQVDIPGMSWGLVPVLAHEGVRYVMLMPNGGRGNDMMVSQFRQKPFWWVGPDGSSRVLFLNAGGYNAGMTKGGKTGRPWFGERDRDKIPEVIRTSNPRADFLDAHLFRELPLLEEAGHPYDLFVVTWAMWDNALLDADLPEAVRSWNSDYAYPRLEIASAHTIVSAFEKKYGPVLPVVKGDFTEYWTDGFGTASRETKTSRESKERLVQAEALWAMLRPGKPTPRAEFDEAWRNILLCTEHTFTYENPAEPYFQDAIWRMKKKSFREADERSHELLDDAVAPATDKSKGALGPAAGPSNGGIALLNTHSWPLGGIVTLGAAESMTGSRVVDDGGRELLSQRLSTGELAFLAPDVPPFGSAHVRVVEGSCSLHSGVRFTPYGLDNGVLNLSVDSCTGNITSLAVKSTGREYAERTSGGGVNAFFWQPARGKGEARSDSLLAITLSESGPLIGEIRVVSTAPGCRSVTRVIRLAAGRADVEISNTVDKLPLLPKDGVHFGFRFAVPGASTRVDIPWGIVELEHDQWPAANRAWNTLQRFVDVSNDSFGVTWCSPDAPLFESGSITANNTADWDGIGDVWSAPVHPNSTLYSWVMNNHWYTNTPLTQEGPVTFRYRILPHGTFDAAEANRFGVAVSQPLVAVPADKNPMRESLFRIDNPRISVTLVKSAADGRSMIVRLRSLSDRDEPVTFTWPGRSPRRMRACDRGEEPGNTDVSQLCMVPAKGLATVRVDW